MEKKKFKMGLVPKLILAIIRSVSAGGLLPSCCHTVRIFQ